MTQTNLDREDRIFLKAELKRHLLLYLLIFIISFVIIFCVVTTLEKQNPELNLKLIYLIFGLIFSGLLFYKLRPMTKELRSGIKNIQRSQISDKKENIKYGWTQNIGVDKLSQPSLTEYYFTIDNQDVEIDEKYYKSFDTGDMIDIHYSTRNGRIMKITKN